MANSYNELFGRGTHSEDASLYAKWDLQEDAVSNTTVSDSSNNSRTATLLGGDDTSTISTTGPKVNEYLPKAFDFDGSADYVDYSTATPSYPLTIMAWTAPDEVTTNQHFFSWNNSGATSSQVALSKIGSQNTYSVRIKDGGSFSSANGGTPSSSTWAHVAGTLTSDVQRELFVNGVSVDTKNQSRTIDNWDNIAIGRLGGSSPTGYYDGSVSEVVVFTRALTSAEINEVMNGPEPLNTAPAGAPTGTTSVGQTLTAQNGTWDSQNNGTVSIARQWYRADDASGTNFTAISGETGPTYQLQIADDGKYIACMEIAANLGGNDAAQDTLSSYTAQVSSTSTITINAPVEYQTFQRNGSDASDITVSGTYTGSPTAVECQIDGGSWVPLDSSPSGGAFSGVLSSITAGQHALSVRFSNDTAVTDSVSSVRVGDVIIWAGEENASGRFTSGQSYTESEGASVYDESGTWVNLTTDYKDPDESTFSILPRIANGINAETGFPVAFVCRTTGDTSLVASSAEWNATSGTEYSALLTAITSSGVNGIAAMLFDQGERDATVGGVSANAYQSALESMHDSLQTGTGFSFPMIIAQTGTAPSATASDLDAIRAGQKQAIELNADIYWGPVSYDRANQNWSTNAEATELGVRWINCTLEILTNVEFGAVPPKVVSAERNGMTVKVRLDRNLAAGTSYTPGAWTFSASSIPITINSVAKTGDAEYEIALATEPSSFDQRVTYAGGNSAAGDTIPLGTGEQPVVPQVFAVNNMSQEFPDAPPSSILRTGPTGEWNVAREVIYLTDMPGDNFDQRWTAAMQACADFRSCRVVSLASDSQFEETETGLLVAGPGDPHHSKRLDGLTIHGAGTIIRWASTNMDSSEIYMLDVPMANRMTFDRLRLDSQTVSQTRVEGCGGVRLRAPYNYTGPNQTTGRIARGCTFTTCRFERFAQAAVVGDPGGPDLTNILFHNCNFSSNGISLNLLGANVVVRVDGCQFGHFWSTDRGPAIRAEYFRPLYFVPETSTEFQYYDEWGDLKLWQDFVDNGNAASYAWLSQLKDSSGRDGNHDDFDYTTARTVGGGVDVAIDHMVANMKGSGPAHYAIESVCAPIKLNNLRLEGASAAVLNYLPIYETPATKSAGNYLHRGTESSYVELNDVLVKNSALDPLNISNDGNGHPGRPVFINDGTYRNQLPTENDTLHNVLMYGGNIRRADGLFRVKKSIVQPGFNP